MKKTICVDFDGVIHSYTSPWTTAEEISDPPVPGAIDFIRACWAHGFEVVIQSVRAKEGDGRLAIMGWLMSVGGLTPQEIGDNGLVITDQKPPAIAYIDDRAVRFEGTFPLPDELEAMIPWNRRRDVSQQIAEAIDKLGAEREPIDSQVPAEPTVGTMLEIAVDHTAERDWIAALDLARSQVDDAIAKP